MVLNRQGRQEREGHETKTGAIRDERTRFGPDNPLGGLCVLCGSSRKFDRFVNATGSK